MTDTMTDEQRKVFLADLGLDGEAPVLAVDVLTEEPAKVKKAKSDKPKKPKEAVDPHTIDVSDIVFDAAMLADYMLDASDIKQASDALFQHYKSPIKGERNKFLHRRISEFIAQVKRQRNPKPADGYIKGKVKATKTERDIAQIMVQQGITADDLAVMLNALAASKA